MFKINGSIKKKPELKCLGVCIYLGILTALPHFEFIIVLLSKETSLDQRKLSSSKTI